MNINVYNFLINYENFYLLLRWIWREMKEWNENVKKFLYTIIKRRDLKLLFYFCYCEISFLCMNFSKTPKATVGVRRDNFKFRPDFKGRSGSYHFLCIKIWKPTGPYQMVSLVNFFSKGKFNAHIIISIYIYGIFKNH